MHKEFPLLKISVCLSMKAFSTDWKELVASEMTDSKATYHPRSRLKEQMEQNLSRAIGTLESQRKAHNRMM